MLLSKAKDLVIRAILNGNFDKLNMDSHTRDTALLELEKEGFLTTIGTSTTGTGIVQSYIPASLFPKGAYFAKYKSFRSQAILKWWVNAPKNFWIIGALLGLISSQAYLIAGMFSQTTEPKIKLQLEVKRGIKSDTISVYQIQ